MPSTNTADTRLLLWPSTVYIAMYTVDADGRRGPMESDEPCSLAEFLLGNTDPETGKAYSTSEDLRIINSLQDKPIGAIVRTCHDMVSWEFERVAPPTK